MNLWSNVPSEECKGRLYGSKTCLICYHNEIQRQLKFLLVLIQLPLWGLYKRRRCIGTGSFLCIYIKAIYRKAYEMFHNSEITASKHLLQFPEMCFWTETTSTSGDVEKWQDYCRHKASSSLNCRGIFQNKTQSWILLTFGWKLIEIFLFRNPMNFCASDYVCALKHCAQIRSVCCCWTEGILHLRRSSFFQFACFRAYGRKRIDVQLLSLGLLKQIGWLDLIKFKTERHVEKHTNTHIHTPHTHTHTQRPQVDEGCKISFNTKSEKKTLKRATPLNLPISLKPGN